MIPFPNISPEIFTVSIGGFEFALRWYAVSYILGFACALFIMKFYIKRQNYWPAGKPPMTIGHADALLSYLIFGVILGGRLGYVIFYNPSYYASDPISIIRIWDGGMSFHGGFLGVIVALILFCLKSRLVIFSTADLIALATPPGLFFGRIANFINAELWGRPTDMPWGVVFPGVRAQSCPDFSDLCARHPSQLYEAALEGLMLFLILIFFASKRFLRYPGFIAGVFFTVYGISRFIVEFFRVSDPQFVSAENPYGFAIIFGQFGISMGQLLCVPMVVAGVIFIIISLTTFPKQN